MGTPSVTVPQPPVASGSARVILYAVPTIPAIGWLVAGGVWGPMVAPLLLLGFVVARGLGRAVWPERARSFATELYFITLVVMAAATLAVPQIPLLLGSHSMEIVGDGQRYAHSGADYLRSLMWGIPLCGPVDNLTEVRLYPPLFFLAGYMPGIFAVRKRPYLWPVFGIVGVIAFTLGGNLAESHGVTWAC